MALNDIKAKDIMTPRAQLRTLQKNDSISSAIGAMEEERIHNVAVLDRDTFIGFFGHQQLVKLQNVAPNSTKLEHFVYKTQGIGKDTNIVDIAWIMYKNNHKILPVLEKDELLGVVSERDVLDALSKSKELRGKMVGDLMSPSPYCVKENDQLSTALAIMRDYRVSRLPVLDGKGKVSGVLESFEAIRRIVFKETPESRLTYYGYTSGPGVGEQLPVYSAPVKELMNKNPILARRDDLLVDKVAEMKNIDESTIIIVDEEGDVVGILAPRDIIEWLAASKKQEGVYMQISGWDPSLVGDFAEAQMDRLLKESIQKLSEIVRIQRISVHFKPYHETFDRIRFSLRARVVTDYGLFVASRHGYDIIKVADELFRALEREIIEHEKKHRDVRMKMERKTKMKKKSKQ